MPKWEAPSAVKAEKAPAKKAKKGTSALRTWLERPGESSEGRAEGAVVRARAFILELENAVAGLEQALAIPEQGKRDSVLAGWEFEIERIEHATDTWANVTAMHPGIIAERLLDDAWSRLPNDFNARPEEERRSLVMTAPRPSVPIVDSIVQASCRDKLLKRIQRDAWCNALLEWRIAPPSGKTDRRKMGGRHKKGEKSRSAILLLLLRSAGLAKGITTHKNLSDIIRRRGRGQTVLAPYSSESADSFDENGLWTPSKHEPLIDQVPRNPHVDAGKMTVREGKPTTSAIGVVTKEEAKRRHDERQARAKRRKK